MKYNQLQRIRTNAAPDSDDNSGVFQLAHSSEFRTDESFLAPPLTHSAAFQMESIDPSFLTSVSHRRHQVSS